MSEIPTVVSELAFTLYSVLIFTLGFVAGLAVWWAIVIGKSKGLGASPKSQEVWQTPAPRPDQMAAQTALMPEKLAEKLSHADTVRVREAARRERVRTEDDW